jgi:hypothetical protein
MKRSLSLIGIFVSILVVLLFFLFMANQTIVITDFFERLKPGLGNPVLYLLLAVYALCLGVPLVIFLRYPRPLRAPPTKSDPAYNQHLERLKNRLSGNPNIGKAFREPTDEVEIEAALAILGVRADAIIKREASVVFMITAISQSGRFDAISVLLAQSRMVWRVAHLYYQRPTVRDMLYLYANIAVSAFVATEIEDLEIDEQLEPVIGGLVAGSAAGAIPGASVIASFLVSSVLTGAANSLFTLRVGVLTKKYCASLTHQGRRAMRRAATIEALGMLGGIVLESGTVLSKRMFGAARKQIGKKIWSPLTNQFSGAKRKARRQPDAE